ncbi:MAG: kelch repeat-containing protein [Hyphomonadaceae bacterium]
MHITRRGAIFGAGASLAACSQSPAPVTSHPAGCWKAAPSLPFAVQEIYPAAHVGRIHIAGGLLSDGVRVTGVSDRHIAYDPATGETETLTPLPQRRHHPYAVSHKGRLFLLGGFNSDPDRVTWIMQSETLAWSPRQWNTFAPAPGPHAETVAASISDRIHIVGGRKPKGLANAAYGDHEDTDRHLVFDFSANSWNTAAPALSARNSAAGAIIGDLWHVVGGRHVTDGPSDAHEVYDVREDRWRTAAPMPKGSGAGGNAAVTLGGALYAFGGEYFENGGKVHAEVWRYDPKADAWTAAAPMPTPRHGLGAVVIGDAAWLVGGAKRPSGSETSNAVERFSLTC